MNINKINDFLDNKLNLYYNLYKDNKYQENEIYEKYYLFLMNETSNLIIKLLPFSYSNKNNKIIEELKLYLLKIDQLKGQSYSFEENILGNMYNELETNIKFILKE